MFTSAAKAVARRTATSHLTASSNLATRFPALTLRSIPARTFSVYHSPLFAAARGSGSPKKTTAATRKSTTTAKKATKKTTKKAAPPKPKEKQKPGPKSKDITPEAAEKADIRRLKKQALWGQDPVAGRVNGWLVFLTDELGNSKMEGNTKLTDSMKGLGDKWTGLSTYDKERYTSRAEDLVEEKTKARKEWIASIPAEQIYLANLARQVLSRKYNKKSPKIHDDRVAKRPLIPYVRFVTSWLHGAGQDLAHLSQGERFKLAADEWNKLSEAEKAPFEKEFREAREQYEKENHDLANAVAKLRANPTGQ